MNEADLLRQELRAAREELVRKRSGTGEEPMGADGPFPLMPDRDEAFLRLALMSVECLEDHIERLERDLEAAEADGWPQPAAVE